MPCEAGTDDATIANTYCGFTMEGVSAREMDGGLGVARSTVQDNLKRVALAGLQWPCRRMSRTTPWKERSVSTILRQPVLEFKLDSSRLRWRVDPGGDRFSGRAWRHFDEAVLGWPRRRESRIFWRAS